jgi:hypothetical protein
MPSRSEQSAGAPPRRWTAEGGGGWERERGRGGVCEWAGGMLVYSIDDLALYLFLHVTDTNGITAPPTRDGAQASGPHLVVYVTRPHGPRSVPWLTRARNAGLAFDAARAETALRRGAVESQSHMRRLYASHDDSIRPFGADGTRAIAHACFMYCSSGPSSSLSSETGEPSRLAERASACFTSLSAYSCARTSRMHPRLIRRRRMHICKPQRPPAHRGGWLQSA